VQRAPDFRSTVNVPLSRSANVVTRPSPDIRPWTSSRLNPDPRSCTWSSISPDRRLSPTLIVTRPRSSAPCLAAFNAMSAKACLLVGCTPENGGCQNVASSTATTVTNFDFCSRQSRWLRALSTKSSNVRTGSIRCSLESSDTNAAMTISPNAISVETLTEACKAARSLSRSRSSPENPDRVSVYCEIRVSCDVTSIQLPSTLINTAV